MPLAGGEFLPWRAASDVVSAKFAFIREKWRLVLGNTHRSAASGFRAPFSFYS
jgi:hypothetical protein